MVVVLGNNDCTIAELQNGTKVLTLGRRHYLWRRSDNTTDSLERITKPHELVASTQKGKYWLFHVTADPRFTQGLHLSIMVTPGQWEEYIIHPAFPRRVGEECIIIPTHERIASPARKALTAGKIR